MYGESVDISKSGRDMRYNVDIETQHYGPKSASHTTYEDAVDFIQSWVDSFDDNEIISILMKPYAEGLPKDEDQRVPYDYEDQKIDYRVSLMTVQSTVLDFDSRDKVDALLRVVRDTGEYAGRKITHIDVWKSVQQIVL